jgi:thiamine-phosphate pyrophosphorylase
LTSPGAEPPRGALAGRLRLLFVTPGDRRAQATAALVDAVLAGGATAILLREPQLPAPALAALARQVALSVAAHDALLLVSRDAALADACGATGVHTGFAGPTVGVLRAARPGRLVSRSAHWPLEPDDLLADVLLLSPFRPTLRSHPRPLLTHEQVRAVLATPGRPPVVALGGLRAQDVAGLPAGLAGVALIRALADAPDPWAAARELRAAVDARCAGGSDFAPAPPAAVA